MRIFSWEDVGRRRLWDAPVAGTIGVFDGVHRGHQALLEELGRHEDGASLVVTFRDNPKKLFNPRYPGDLMTWSEKERVLADCGVDLAVVIDFSPAFSTMPGKDFFLFLKKSFVFSRLVLGWNFSFGKASATTTADLGWLANPETRLTVLPPYCWQGQVVSSSAIRGAITTGDLALARNLLGRPYGFKIEGEGRDRAFVTKLLPPPGRYHVRLDGQGTEMKIEEKCLTWESPPGLGSHEVVFV